MESIKEGNRFWHRVLRDMHFTIEDMIAEGETVVVRWTARGTHQGDWEMELGTVIERLLASLAFKALFPELSVYAN